MDIPLLYNMIIKFKFYSFFSHIGTLLAIAGLKIIPKYLYIYATFHVYQMFLNKLYHFLLSSKWVVLSFYRNKAKDKTTKITKLELRVNSIEATPSLECRIHI